jgi:hypothetical protein
MLYIELKVILTFGCLLLCPRYRQLEQALGFLHNGGAFHFPFRAIDPRAVQKLIARDSKDAAFAQLSSQWNGINIKEPIPLLLKLHLQPGTIFEPRSTIDGSTWVQNCPSYGLEEHLNDWLVFETCIDGLFANREVK